MPDDTLVDFAVVAFREEGRWEVGPLPARAAENLPGLLAALRQQPSEGPALALCSYGDVAHRARCAGPGRRDRAP